MYRFLLVTFIPDPFPFFLYFIPMVEYLFTQQLRQNMSSWVREENNFGNIPTDGMGVLHCLSLDWTLVYFKSLIEAFLKIVWTSDIDVRKIQLAGNQTRDLKAAALASDQLGWGCCLFSLFPPDIYYYVCICFSLIFCVTTYTNFHHSIGSNNFEMGT